MLHLIYNFLCKKMINYFAFALGNACMYWLLFFVVTYRKRFELIFHITAWWITMPRDYPTDWLTTGQQLWSKNNKIDANGDIRKSYVRVFAFQTWIERWLAVVWNTLILILVQKLWSSIKTKQSHVRQKVENGTLFINIHLQCHNELAQVANNIFEDVNLIEWKSAIDA